MRKSKYTIEDMHILALKRNGKCLSSEYKNNGIKLEWLCNKCNYKWSATFNNIASGRWCPKCGKRKGSK